MSNEEKKNSFKGYQEEMVANRLVIITEQITIYKTNNSRSRKSFTRIRNEISSFL